MRLDRLATAIAGGLMAAALVGPPKQANAAADFAAWLQDLRIEARQAGVSDSTLNAALSDIEPIEKVVELDRRQPEGRLTFVEYKTRVISDARITKGRKLLAEHGERLEAIEARYGVPAEIIVSLWGIESSFGEFKGRFPVVDSLATLAYDGRRAELFRRELISALKIIDNGDVEADSMFGSWAGAMGQSQFMPSTYLDYAVDANGDGRRDIWTNLDDTFASMANYLARMGWDRNYIWGREVNAPHGAKQHAGRDNKAPLATWHERGIRRTNGNDLPNVDIHAALIAHDDGEGPSYLVYNNFDVLMRWNRSTYFATSVGLLADQIR